MNTENWKPAVGLEGLYEVSDMGRVRSVARETASGTRGGMALKLQNFRGYSRAYMTNSGKSMNHFVHRLVAAAFIGPPPEGRYDINHKNGIKSDNCVANLEYCTKSENRKHAFVIGLQSNRGTSHSQAKLDDETVVNIRRRVAAGEKQSDVAKDLGISQSNVSYVANGKRWSHVAGGRIV